MALKRPLILCAVCAREVDHYEWTRAPNTKLWHLRVRCHAEIADLEGLPGDILGGGEIRATAMTAFEPRPQR